MQRRHASACPPALRISSHGFAGLPHRYRPAARVGDCPGRRGHLRIGRQVQVDLRHRSFAARCLRTGALFGARHVCAGKRDVDPADSCLSWNRAIPVKSGASGYGKKGAKCGVLWDNIAEKPAVTDARAFRLPVFRGVMRQNEHNKNCGTEERT